MASKRKLSDLYVLGTALTFDDGAVEDDGKSAAPVEVWLQKISTVDNERAIRMANAKRASILALQKNQESEDYQGIMADVYDRDHDGLVEELVNDEVGKKTAALEAELEAEDNWSKDGYLQGLRDAWVEELGRRYAEDPEDPEAKRVFEEFTKFSAEADVRIEKIRKDLTREFNRKSDDDLQELWRKAKLESEGDHAWLREYRKAEIYFAVRDPQTHRKYYFSERTEVDELPQEIYLKLLIEYRSIGVDVLEGKESQPTPDSSSPSDAQDQSGTENSSGPSAATA